MRLIDRFTVTHKYSQPQLNFNEKEPNRRNIYVLPSYTYNSISICRPGPQNVQVYVACPHQLELIRGTYLISFCYIRGCIEHGWRVTRLTRHMHVSRRSYSQENVNTGTALGRKKGIAWRKTIEVEFRWKINLNKCLELSVDAYSLPLLSYLYSVTQLIQDGPAYLVLGLADGELGGGTEDDGAWTPGAGLLLLTEKSTLNISFPLASEEEASSSSGSSRVVVSLRCTPCQKTGRAFGIDERESIRSGQANI